MGFYLSFHLFLYIRSSRLFLNVLFLNFLQETKRENYSSGNADKNLYIQHYNTNGLASFQNGGILLSDADNNQISPLVRPDQLGGAFAVWEDQKDGSISIYAQHIDPSTGVTLQEDGVSMYYGIDGNALLYSDADLYQMKSKSNEIEI